MVQNETTCCLVDQSPLSNMFIFTVSIPKKVTDSFFNLATEKQQLSINPAGFKKGFTPVSYIQEHFKSPIMSHLKDLGLKFFAISTLLEQIRLKKLVIVGTPELHNIKIDNQGNVIYTFQAYTTKEMYMQSWKYLPFKSIPRKQYRDIDKQVLSFLQEEERTNKLYNPAQGIQIGDWVHFKVWIIDQNNNPIFEKHSANIWLKIGDEEPDVDFQNVFIGKQIGTRITTDNPSFQKYFCENSSSNYTFIVEIQDIVPHNAFSFELFKNYFKIKTHKDLLLKITEVFSFNNDISQRRLISHEALNTIIKKNHIIIPDDAINKQKRQIINDLQFKPDFIVYKMDPEFDTHVSNMANKQLLDGVIAEHIGYQDNLLISHNDIKTILHITQRARLKDFLYFPFIKSQIEGQEFPIEYESLYNFCLKEKAINHIIYHLTKK